MFGVLITNNPVETEAAQMLRCVHERIDGALHDLEDGTERLVELLQLPVSAGALLANTIASVRNALELIA